MGRSPAGFTLPELVTTLVIIGILAAVAVPRFMDRTGFDVFGYSESVREGLRFAQKSAIAKRRNTCVSLASGVLTLKVSTDFGGACAPALLDPSSGQPYSLPARSGVAAGNVDFSFDAVGRPSAAQSISISGGGSNQTITVEAETGYVY